VTSLDYPNPVLIVAAMDGNHKHFLGGLYVLNGRQPIRYENALEWAEIFEKSKDRVVARSMGLGMRISTVFLGLDHNYGISGDPLLFETMVFGGPHDQDQERYSTWEEAETGHVKMVQSVFGLQGVLVTWNEESVS